MNRQRLIALAVAAVIVIGAALFFSDQRYAARRLLGGAPGELRGSAFLPALARQLDDVTSLSIHHDGDAPNVTLRRQGATWRVADRGDYPADNAKVRKLLLSLADAKIVEQKTANPDNYSIIGVEDAAKRGGAGSQIDYSDKMGSHSVIIGKAVGSGNFARRGGEQQTFAIEPAISVESEARYWIDPKLLDVSGQSIKSLDVQPAAGPAYSVRRIAVAAAAASASTSTPGAAVGDSTAGAPFVLDKVPPGRKAVDSAVIAPPVSAFSGLDADDVAAVGDVDFSKPAKATLTLANGNTLTLIGSESGDKRWIQVQAPQDAALSAQTAGRAFAIATYRYDDIFRPLEKLLVPKPVPAGTNPPDAKKAGAKKTAASKPLSSPAN